MVGTQCDRPQVSASQNRVGLVFEGADDGDPVEILPGLQVFRQQVVTPSEPGRGHTQGEG